MRKSTSLSDSLRRRKKHRTDSDDRISDLPDSILGHILSFLPTKNAVATGILSKRWKFMWTAAINLDFCCPKNYTGSVENFVQFVNYVLLFHKPAASFNKLSLTWKKRCIPMHVNTWVSAAIARDVSELFVYVEMSKLPIQMQTSIFSSEKLRSLELKCRICISSEIMFSLPRLERLKLISVYFRNEEAFSKLIDGCPVLKHLVIRLNIGEMIRYGYVEILDEAAFKCRISSTSLRHLELIVYDKYPSPPTGTTACCGVELDAPSLEYIKLDDQINSIVVLQETLNFLGEANLIITPFIYETDVPNYCNLYVTAVRAFGCAKSLNLSDEVIRAVSCATVKLSTRFNRLTRLEVTLDRNNWSSLQDLIELSDNLEVLIVNKTRDYSIYPLEFDSNWKKPDLVPKCFSNSLRTVSIGAYDGYPDELAMVDCIIKHGSVLKLMQICFGETIKDDFQRKFELLQAISAFPRKSTICELKFGDYSSEHNAL